MCGHKWAFVRISAARNAHPGNARGANCYWLVAGTGHGAAENQQANGKVPNFHQASLPCAADQQLAIGSFKPAQKAHHVKLHGAQRDAQEHADGFVFLAFHYPDQDFALTWGERELGVLDFEF